MISDTFDADGVFQVPLFALFVVELVQVFATDRALVLFGKATDRDGSTFLADGSKKNNEINLKLVN